MRLLITGVCGFAGSALARTLLERTEGIRICGIDNLMRSGAETNRALLRRFDIDVRHGDVRCASDVECLPDSDWVIDAAANPSVLAGFGSQGSSRQLMEHNVGGMLNVLEYCKTRQAGLILLSSSRVYSLEQLAALPLRQIGSAFQLDSEAGLPAGVSCRGISTDFSTAPPISLYGSSKLASEILALEYADAFDFPVWVNRCGVLAGAGQFGTPDQGIFSYWIHAHRRRLAMRFTGFGGSGYQVRDAMHPRDLATLVEAQISSSRKGGRRLYCAGGGPENAISLAQLTEWCDGRFGKHQPVADERPRRYDSPWLVMDSSKAAADFDWRCSTSLPDILQEISRHADEHPEWLALSGL